MSDYKLLMMPPAGTLNAVNNLSEIATQGANAQSAARTNLGISYPTLTSLGVASVGSLAGRRRTVNGDMRIDQANAGASISVAASAFAFSVDKWKGFGVGAAGVFTLQQQSATPPAGFTNYLRATVTTADAAPAAGSSYLIRHAVEGYSIQDMQFGTAGNTQSVMLGFWVRISIAGTFSGSLQNQVANRSYVFTFAVPAANVWQFVSLQIPVDVTGSWSMSTANGVVIDFDLGSGATATNAPNIWTASSLFKSTGSTSLLATNGATFDITGVQFEPGSLATAYEQRTFGDELRLCQREFEKSFLIATAPVQNAGSNTGEQQFAAGIAAAASDLTYTEFIVHKRVAPTITYYNPNAANAQARDQTATADCSATTASNNTERGFLTTTTGNATTVTGNKIAFHYTADARL